MPFKAAEMVAVCVVDTAETVAVKLAAIEPAATVTLAGMTIAEELSVRDTATPPVGAAPVRVTRQTSDVAPVTVVSVQFTALRVVAGLSCRLTVEEAPFVEAVMVAVAAEVTDAIDAVKLAEVAPEGTVTEVGTVTAALLLVRVTVKPACGAAELSAIEQVSVPAAE